MAAHFKFHPRRSPVFSLRRFVLVSSIVAGTAALTASASEIHMCINSSKGTVRLVATATACNPKTETALTWNEKGPVGPAGPVGPQGKRGPTGSVGPQGPAGKNGTNGTNGTNGATGPQGPGGFNGAQLFTTPGTQTWTAPPNITHVMVELVGSGGAGWGPLVSAGAYGQGGGGAYTKILVPVTPGDQYTVFVGPGVAGPGVPSEFASGNNVLAAAAGGIFSLGSAGGAGGSADTNSADLFASPGLPGAANTSTVPNGVQLVPNGVDYGEGGAGVDAVGVPGSPGANGAVLLTW
jgi:hypothetical protein